MLLLDAVQSAMSALLRRLAAPRYKLSVECRSRASRPARNPYRPDDARRRRGGSAGPAARVNAHHGRRRQRAVRASRAKVTARATPAPMR